MDYNLGYHVGKQSSYYKTVKDYNTPIQIFTGSTKSWKKAAMNEKIEKDIVKTKEFVVNNKVQLFIHSIYLINLGRIGEEFEKARESLVYDLIIGNKLGSKGVVVHVAKALKIGELKAVDNMFKNILSILEHINESCPLLIETPAGQGTEVLCNVENFIVFYNQFTKRQKQKVKICIDTCHVFASGYDPLDYIEKWNDKCPGSIVLVHFNDSKCECGSKKDRHAPEGEGFIGFEKLNKVKDLCVCLSIPMIREY